MDPMPSGAAADQDGQDVDATVVRAGGGAEGADV